MLNKTGNITKYLVNFIIRLNITQWIAWHTNFSSFQNLVNYFFITLNIFFLTINQVPQGWGWDLGQKLSIPSASLCFRYWKLEATKVDILRSVTWVLCRHVLLHNFTLFSKWKKNWKSHCYGNQTCGSIPEKKLTWTSYYLFTVTLRLKSWFSLNKKWSCLWKNNVYLSASFIFIKQLGKCLILQSMNCEASTSPIFLLFFQTSHSLQWLQSIANTKIFSVFSNSSQAACSGRAPSTTPQIIKSGGKD